MAFPVTFMTANFVARQTGFRYVEWSEGNRATNAWYALLETYRERFDELLRAVTTFDVDGIDIWTSQAARAGPRHRREPDVPGGARGRQATGVRGRQARPQREAARADR